MTFPAPDQPQLLQHFLESLPHLAAITDAQLRWKAFNSRYAEEFAKLFGVQPEIGASLKESLQLSDERHSILSSCRRALSGEEFELISDYGDATGTRITYKQTLGPIRNDAGEITGAFLIAERVDDLTEQEAQLKLQQERFHKAFDYSGIGMAIVHPDGHMLRANKALCEILGFSAEQLARMTFMDITHPDDLNEDLLLLEKLAAGHVDSYEMDKRYYHADGHIVWVHLTVTMVPHDDGSPRYYIGQIQDITHRRMAEEQLVEARDAALRADVAKSNFLAVMSHEIRTPLNSIIGFADILTTSDLDEEQREWIGHVQSSGENLLALINDILDFSKIEAGSLELDLGPVVLEDVVKQVIGLMRGKAFEKELQLTYNIQENCPQVIFSDDYRLRQILLNLLSNALKFTEKGSVWLEAECNGCAGEEPMLEISVSDTGIGISEEARKRLFKPFMQADSSTTRQYGGTGLGLAICSRLAEVLEGEVEVKSREGVGSTFILRLPLPEKELQRDTVRAPDAGQKQALQHIVVLSGHVLLVDDIPANLTMLGTRLRRLGLETVSATSVEQALRLMEKEGPFDAVLTDLMMPRTDGYHLARAVREKFPRDTPKLVLVSSLPLHMLPKRPERELFDGVLAKPVSMVDLHNVLAPLLGQTVQSRLEAEKTRPEQERQFAEDYPADILIAEDTNTNRVLLLHLLKQLGYDQVRVSTNGRECVNQFQRQPPDIVLMDVHMPEMNGLEAARKILDLQEKGQGNPGGVKLLALTADALKGDAQKCYDAGMHGYLAKPFRKDQLREALEKLLVLQSC